MDCVVSKLPTLIESFCGAGGISLGMEQAGFDVRLSFDLDEAAISTHEHNFSHLSRCYDASLISGVQLLEETGLERGELDVFSGGPPCQGFSKQRRGAHLLDDPRNHLVKDYARLVLETQAKAFLFENVQIFGQKRGRSLIDEMRNVLRDYNIYTYFVCASDFGLAQARGRFLMIGLRKDVSDVVPMLTKSGVIKTVRDAIGDIPPPPEDYSVHHSFCNHQKNRITKENEERISHVPQGGGWKDIPWDLRLPCHQVVDPSTGGWPDVYGRLEWDGFCPTITGGFDSFSRGRYGHPEQNRAITPREAARLQGFPDNFCFMGNKSEVRRQIGNAVPPPLAKVAGEAILRSLQLESNAGNDAIWPAEISEQKELAL